MDTEYMAALDDADDQENESKNNGRWKGIF